MVTLMKLLKDLRDEADGRLPETTALINRLLAETDGDDFSPRTFVLASVTRSMELEKRVLALEKRLRITADRLVSLTTSSSPTPPGTVVPLSVVVKADGSTDTFTLRRTTVLVITDLVVTMPRTIAAPGRYAAALGNTPLASTRLDIQVDTAVDGFQKTISLREGMPFTTIPQFATLGFNPSEMYVQVYGYVARRR
jgi:hypothetical protein